MAKKKRGLPKKYAKLGFKEGWKQYKESKTYKAATTKRKVVKVKKVARRRTSRRKRKRRAKPKIPLEVAVAGIATMFTPAETGWATPIVQVQHQDWEGLGHNLKSGFLGMSGDDFNVMRALNPFDMGRARYIKMLFWAGVMSKIRKRAVKIPFNKVPFIGRYIS